MYYSGIDQHKQFSYITTVNDDGIIVKQAELKNNNFDILNYFSSIGNEHSVTVETTGGWYWMNDLLSSHGINLKLAHAKYVKAIAYAKVKIDKVDSHILAQLLRLNFIPEAYKISDDVRPLRDTLRARLRLSQKRTSCLNFMNRMLEKFNINDPSLLSDFYKLQYQQFDNQEQLLTDAAVHALQYYPPIKKYHDSKLRKKKKQVAHAILAKEIARIVYYVLKNKSHFNNHFKGIDLEKKKSNQWLRITNPDV